MRLNISVAVLAALAGIVAGQGACFVPNGTNRHSLTNIKNNRYMPCEGEGHSMCCNTVSGDKCQPNGLCWNEGFKITWRESCTDPTWQSPKCLKLCINDETSTDGVPSSGTDVLVTKCADESYCCGNDRDARACCNQGKGVSIVNGQVVNPSASSSSRTVGPATSAAASTAPSSSSSSSRDSTTSSTPDSEGSSSNAGVIGGAVGGAVGGVAVLALAAWFFWYRKKRSSAPAPTGAMPQVAPGYQYVAGPEAKYAPEPQYYASPSELPGTSHPAELGGDSAPSGRW